MYRETHADVIGYILICSFAFRFAYRRKHVRYELIPAVKKLVKLNTW